MEGVEATPILPGDYAALSVTFPMPDNTSTGIEVADGVQAVKINEVWVFQHDSLGGDDALHSGTAEIKNDCLYIDDAVVVWHVDQVVQAGQLINSIQAGTEPEVSLAGGGISLDEGDTPIPPGITEICPTRVLWYTSPGP